MSRYVEVPRARLEAALDAAGFKVDPEARGELTYFRTHDRDHRLTVKVLTSVPLGGGRARACGEDAIRVLALFTWRHRKGDGYEYRTKSLASFRVFRVTSVEGVLERLLERARDAWRVCNKFVREDMEKRGRILVTDRATPALRRLQQRAAAVTCTLDGCRDVNNELARVAEAQRVVGETPNEDDDWGHDPQAWGSD